MIDIADIDRLAAGQVLSLDERALLEPAVQMLRETEGFSMCGLWGRINGDAADYIVVVGTGYADGGVDQVLSKKFFFCTSENLKLAPLPQSDGHPEVSPRQRFSGEPATELATVIVPLDADSKESDAPPTDEDMETRSYTEAEHLGYVVRQVDWHTAVCPKGAFCVDPKRRVTSSISFNGLGPTDATQLDSYVHLREPANKLTAFDKAGVLKPTECLDAIPSSHPRGAWSLQTDMPQKAVTIRSLLFPGYTFVHRVNTKWFGSVYVGDGVKNADIAFML